MALTLGDNFSYQGAKPLDARLKYDTLANMKAVADATMYDGCMAYCVATDKTYQWKASNTVDADTGKWREFSSGGGGGTSDYEDLDNKPSINDNELSGNKSSSDLGLASKEDMDKAYKTDDTAFTAIADGDYIPVYDTSASTKKRSLWSNIKSVLKTYFDTLYQKTLTAGTYISFSGTDNTTINASLPTLGVINRSDIYDTTEKVVGKWTDGKPIYQKTFTGTTPTVTTDGTWVENYISVGASIDAYCELKGVAVNSSGNTVIIETAAKTQGTNTAFIGLKMMGFTNSASSNANKIRIGGSSTSISAYTYYITASYTKTTDAANSYNYANENDYSTSEKIVGTWIDGKPLYQKTFTGTVPTVTTTGTSVDAYVSIGASVKRCIGFKGDMLLPSGNNAPIIYFADSQSVDGKLIGISMLVCTNSASSNANKLRIRSNNTSYNESSYTITLQYTKTTD